MAEALELLVDREGGRVRLRAPDVGLFAAALAQGALVAPGAHVGTLTRLGVRHRLVVPAGVEGRVANDPPERIHQPVGWGDVLVELDELRATAAAAEVRAREAAASGAPVLRATSSGRFWHRPAPGEPAFVQAGSVVKDGEPVGLLEVMKTFGHVVYRATGGLPRTAKVVRLVAADGADVRPGEPLLEVEPAERAG